MRVIKVLNNSLVLALNDEGQEIILMGKGIGFQKTIGYKLSPKEIDKVFVLRIGSFRAGSSGWPPRQTASILRWPSLSSTMPWRTTT